MIFWNCFKKELEHFKRMNTLQEEELLKRQQIEKRSLPKRIRSEMKTRELMFRESLRISIPNNVFSEDERDTGTLLKRFQESEKERYRNEQARQEKKHKKQIEELKNSFAMTIRELEQIQKDKKKSLMEHETMKIQMLENENAEELRQWKSQLKPRKLVSSNVLFQLEKLNCNYFFLFNFRNSKKNLSDNWKNKNVFMPPHRP